MAIPSCVTTKSASKAYLKLTEGCSETAGGCAGMKPHVIVSECLSVLALLKLLIVPDIFLLP